MRLSLALLAVLVVSSCAYLPPVETFPKEPGFFYGLLHGFLAPFTLIGSLFAQVEMYDIGNNGFWYDLGFLLGASAILGGSAKGAARR